MGESTYEKLERCVLIPYMVCFKWGPEKVRACLRWVVEFAPVCVETGAEQTRSCISWLPSWLSWLEAVCVLWFVITIIVCILFVLVAGLVCYLFGIIHLIICLVWGIILLISCPFRS